MPQNGTSDSRYKRHISKLTSLEADIDDRRLGVDDGLT